MSVKEYYTNVYQYTDGHIFGTKCYLTEEKAANNVVDISGRKFLGVGKILLDIKEQTKKKGKK